MLTIPLDTVGWIIVKAREFDVKIEDSADGEGASDDVMGVLEDRADDATEEELTSWIEDLTDTEQAELVALFWLGRGDGDVSDFADLVEQARSSRVGKTSKYLLGEPLLADYLEEALEALGHDTSELESGLR
ncbi:MAG: DUF3775 domain-containing protein [Rhodobacteraceae bacterium]|nr:MAG: DUF3775 domain-containing protein [Paracoccaceae bacterium]